MVVELFSDNSPESLSTRMFLDLQEIDYEERKLTNEEKAELSIEKLPVVFIDFEPRVVGYSPEKLSKLFSI